jgi:energy-coupling factor transport system permease protein
MKLDPRTKFLATVGLIAAIFLTENLVYFSGMVVLLLITFLISKTPPRIFIRNILLLSWLLVFTFFLRIWGEMASVYHESFTQGFSVGKIFIPYKGLLESLLAVSQLVMVVGWVTILGCSTSPLEIVHGLERLFRPLRILGIPVHKFTIVTMLSIRFIPILFEEKEHLVRAYIARGMDINSKNIPARLKHYVLLCVPLFNSMLRRVDHLAIAMESRAFQAQADRTSLFKLHMRSADYLALVGSMVLLLTAWVIT